jgi:spore coat protein U-like protein
MDRTIKLALLASGAFLLLLAAPARAQQLDTTTINVSARVTPSCTITTTPGFNFGDIDVTAAVPQTTLSGDLVVRCTKTRTTTSYELRLSSTNNWAMTNGPDDSLQYTITQVNGVAWTAGSPVLFQSSSKNSSITIPIVARLNGGDLDVSVGAYSDTITAEIWL